MKQFDQTLITIDEKGFYDLLDQAAFQAIVVFWVANSAHGLFQGEVIVKVLEKFREKIEFYQLPIVFNSRKKFIFIQQLPCIVFIKSGVIQDILNGIQTETKILDKINELGFLG